MQSIASAFDEDKLKIWLLALSGAALLISFLDVGSLPFDAAWLAVILCGIPILKDGVVGLVTRFDIKADVLVSLALIAAVIIGEIFAASEVAFIMTIGALLEERTVAKARASIEKLVRLTPQTARIVSNGEESVITAENVQVDDILRVLPGETVAVDGIIVNGQTSIDQSIMTGESLPVDKQTGDQVCSGTVNQFGAFDMRATKVGQDSSLQRMIRLVESADAGKAKIVRITDRWATWIVVIALTAAVLTWLVTGEIIRSVTILVVFCPCALVLATPTAIMAGIGNATKYGILVREGDALERLARVKRIGFDKTGTLTYGKPAVTAIYSYGADISPEQLMSLTACAELRSEHPLGKAIVAHFKSVSQQSPPEPQEFKMLPGRGVYARREGFRILAGNRELLADHSLDVTEEMIAAAAQYVNEGSTIIYVGVNDKAAGFIALTDTLRPDAADMVKRIENIGIRSILLTGDHHQAARSIAEMAGIGDVHSECLPEGKLAVIDRYQNNNEMVCMVGDGINDAPALKKAYVGVAMGGIGSDIAIDAADIALVRDDIKFMPHLLLLARKTIKTIHINVILSMVLNFVAVLLAMAGLLGPVAGALVHNVGSVAVIINSALLLHWRE